jgi:murein DD-endopeptidase MepM/ murein hydrolase activator NlpD
MRRRRYSILVLGSWLLLFACLTLTAPKVSAAPLAEEAPPIEHVVQSGDTLFRIAERYDTTVEAIAEANGISDPSRIAVGQTLLIPATAGAAALAGNRATAQERSELTHYLVVPGDTVNAVAWRFGTTPEAVAELNGLVNPTVLPAGRWLQVPGQYVGRLHRIAEGETAVGLALRYDVPLWEFLSVNGLRSSGALMPGQRVWVPSEIATGTLPPPFLTLDVGPGPVVQGNTVRVKADLLPGAEVRGVFADEELNFVIENGAHYALFGIHALAEPRVYTLALLATDSQGDELYVTRSVEVIEGTFEYSELDIPLDLLDTEALVAERARIAEIRPVFNSEKYWDGMFTRPITTEITSAFGSRRLYRYPSGAEFSGYHEGTDFNGVVGSPVRAPAAGVVVLAEPLYLRGNAVVIDHGWGVYTGYWHLSQIDVAVGQRVDAGELIALVGSTGRSTGAHLHWDLWVNGTNVRALQWTEQVFP